MKKRTLFYLSFFVGCCQPYGNAGFFLPGEKAHRYRSGAASCRLGGPWREECCSRDEDSSRKNQFVIPAGYRIRVDISSSDFPQWDRNLNNGGKLGSDGLVAAVVATHVVHHSEEFPSSILLPVMGEGW